MPSISDWVLLQKNADKIYWAAALMAFANPTTHRFGKKMISYGGRATFNMMRGAMLSRGPGLMGTTFTSSGTATLGSTSVNVLKFGGAAALGYGIGAGILVGGAHIGETHYGLQEGSTDHAIDFATGQADNWYDYTVHYNAYKIIESKLLD